MKNSQVCPDKIALIVVQQTVWVLARWAGVNLPDECHFPEDCAPTEQAKKRLDWCDFSQLKQPHNDIFKPLRLLFDRVKLNKDQDKEHKGQDKEHYWQPIAIAEQYPTIPYPQTQEPTSAELECLRLQIQDEISQLQLNQQDWENLSLLTLILEKFGSFISFGESDVALVDMARTTAAVAAAIANNSTTTELSLVAGDLSGIQKFIYTISSDGALKSLRARSFYLELVTEEVVQQLLTRLKLPRTNVIYAGGGNLYLLAAGTEDTKKTVEQVRQQFNQWLLGEFQGKVFLALDCLNFPITDIATAEFAKHWSNVTTKLAVHKSRKFADQISDFIEPYYSHTPCKVCHRDDVREEELKPLNDDVSVLACETCRSMFCLGRQLLQVEAIVRSQREHIPGALHTLSFKLPATKELTAVNIHYHLFDLFDTRKQIVPDSDTVLLVNDWTVKHYQFRHFRNYAPLLLGNYGQRTQNPDETGFMSASEMADQAKGIKRVGYLRMDVDRLGQIFAEGLGEKQTLPRLAGLSRQMSYFFKVYLNSLAKNRLENLPQTQEKFRSLTNKSRHNLLFIYAGGDDLFVSGAWNEIIEFAFDVYQCFRAYTGHNLDITLSGGISIDDVKFPLYQAAKASGNAEEAAKGNGRDSLGLFGQVFKWDEWLGIEDVKLINSDIREYLNPEVQPNLLGVLPFVERLEKQKIDINYSRSFVRNLLTTAQLQEQELQKFEDNKSTEALGTRYYLHLPKIAYTLARLPNKVLTDEEFSTSLKNPYNAPYFRAIATWIEFLNRPSNS